MSRGRVVMLLTNDFESDPRVEKEAVALISDGWEVTVLAWERRQEHAAAETRSGIQIERIGPLAPYGGGVRNLSNFREFWRLASARTVAIAPDVVHCHDLDTAPAGLAAVRSLRRGDPTTGLVLDFHELYRESRMVPQEGALGVAAGWFVGRLERRSIAEADVVVIANPGTVGSYDAYGAREKIVLVENAPDLDRFSPQASARSAPGDPLRVCFIGQKRYTGGLLALMEAVQTDARFSALLAGGGVAEEEIAEAAATHERIEVIGRVRYDSIPRYYEGCDVVHAVYDASLGNVRTLFPVKVMEGMACAMPVIVSRGTWIAEYVETHGIGIAVDEKDVGDVAGALAWLADNPAAAAEMGTRGRAIVEAELNWQAASARLLDAYRRFTR